MRTTSNVVRQSAEQENSISVGYPNTLIDVLIAKVCVAAIHCAVIASCYNGLESGKTKADLRSTLDWVPSEPTLVSVIRHKTMSDFDNNLDPACVTALDEMISEVQRGQLTLESLFQESLVMGEHRAIVVYLQAIKATWQLACRKSKVALLELARIATVADCYRPGKLANLNVAVKLLADAGDGKCPCLDDEGQPTFRALPPARMMRRYSIGQDCVVTVAGRKTQAFARDISIAGMGLEKVAQGTPNDRLVIALESGRLFTSRG
jgi:hypothetical protein